MTRISVAGADDWADACSRSFVQLGVTAAEPGFRADLTQQRLDDGVRVATVTSQGSEVYRSRRMAAHDDADDLLFAIHGSGRGVVEQDGRVASLQRGRATLYDTAFPYRLRFDGFMTERVLQVPRALVDPTGTLSSGLTAQVFSDTDPRIRAISERIATVVRAGSSAGSAPELVELIGSVLRHPIHGTQRRSREQLRAEALAAIARAATDPRTDPGIIAEQLQIPLRTLQAAFTGQEQSVAGEIRKARVDRTVALVRSGVSVTEAAYRSGFSDPGTCARAVRRHYGVAPSAILPTADTTFCPTT